VADWGAITQEWIAFAAVGAPQAPLMQAWPVAQSWSRPQPGLVQVASMQIWGLEQSALVLQMGTHIWLEQTQTLGAVHWLGSDAGQSRALEQDPLWVPPSLVTVVLPLHAAINRPAINSAGAESLIGNPFPVCELSSR